MHRKRLSLYPHPSHRKNNLLQNIDSTQVENHGLSWLSNHCPLGFASNIHVQPLLPSMHSCSCRQVLSLFLNLLFLVLTSMPLFMWFPLPGKLSYAPIRTLPFLQNSSNSSPVNLPSTTLVMVERSGLPQKREQLFLTCNARKGGYYMVSGV